ncbi:MAG TPA: 3D domain-containing protein [Ureibacillus sp.]|nr:3D domain-containing protein [Ureibacillus sp.]
MKTKLSIIILFIVYSVSTIHVSGMEIDRAIKHTDDDQGRLIITGQWDESLNKDDLDRNTTFYKTVQPEIYQVQEGDTLFRIAYNYNLELEDLMEWNNLLDYTIHPGEEILLHEDEEGEKVSKKHVNNVALNQQTVASSTKGQASTKEITVTATAYTAYCEGCSGTTAIGIDLRSNPNQKVIAVDPNIIPLGTKVWVEGYGEAIAADTGSAIKGHKIDVFIPTRNAALEWGRKQVKVKILN